jgi:hypothetical protein
MILSGSLVQINGFGLVLVSAMKRWIASLEFLGNERRRAIDDAWTRARTNLRPR